jgi:hypothetical protein
MWLRAIAGNLYIAISAGAAGLLSWRRLQRRLMAYPNARLLRLSKYGLEPVTVEQTDHYKVMREFCADPAGFVEAAVDE